MAYKPELVARVKGALRAGLGPKLISSVLERIGISIPTDTIKEWSAEDCRGTVEADVSVELDIAEALLGRFAGSEAER